jgi:hypothetical protein
VKKLIETLEARNVKELIEALQDLTTVIDHNVVYVETDGEYEYVKVSLIENTLTDGSKTYDIRVR